jgi:hypothetical protein
LTIAALLGAQEWQTITYLRSYGITTQATILELRIEGQRWQNYFARYEFEIVQPNGEPETIIHEEEITAPRYHALQVGGFLPVHYTSKDSLLIRSEIIALDIFKPLTMYLLIAGVLFLPGWVSLLTLIARWVGVERWYSKYILLIPLFTYLSLFIGLVTMALGRTYEVPIFPIILAPLCVTLLLIIGDIFHLPWISDLRPRS